MDTAWIEIVVKTTTNVIERAEAALLMATPLGLYSEDYSDLESCLRSTKSVDLIEDDLLNKDRGTVLLHIYFPPGADNAICVADVRRCLDRAGLSEVTPSVSHASAGSIRDSEYEIVSIDTLAEEDWANNWKQFFRPLRIGKGILVKPEWEIADNTENFEDDDVDAVISIDPGMAFGTGGHSTTKLCLELIEKHVKSVPKPIDMLDVGCGSGILAIAAVKLGARSAIGVDIDEYAVRNAEANAVINGVADKIVFRTGDLLDGVDGYFGLIAANIVADTVIKLMQSISRVLSPDGAIILSGIIGDREPEVIDSAAVYGYSIVDVLRDDGWTALLLRAMSA